MSDNNKELIQIMKELNNNTKYLLAIELSKSGLTQSEIGKRLKIATKKVNEMLKGTIINPSNI